jgi:hypothetical protein
VIIVRDENVLIAIMIFHYTSWYRFTG